MYSHRVQLLSIASPSCHFRLLVQVVGLWAVGWAIRWDHRHEFSLRATFLDHKLGEDRTGISGTYTR